MAGVLARGESKSGRGVGREYHCFGREDGMVKIMERTLARILQLLWQGNCTVEILVGTLDLPNLFAARLEGNRIFDQGI